MAYQTILVEAEDHVTLIKLNRPDALNALNSPMMKELAAALQEADANPTVRCIIITGSEKAFAAGADIVEMADKTFDQMYFSPPFYHEIEAITKIRKPIIAAVSGYCLGGGCELAMMCDIIIAADSVKFGQPEITLGIIAGMGGTQRLTKLIGKSKAMDMHLTGRFMEAEEAERAGLASRIFPAKELLKEAKKIALKITEKSLLSTTMAKECINRAEEIGLSEGIRFEQRAFLSLFATDDQKEGMAAFIEKREPQFRDK